MYLPQDRDDDQIPPIFRITCANGTFSLNRVQVWRTSNNKYLRIFSIPCIFYYFLFQKIDSRILKRWRNSGKIFLNGKVVENGATLKTGDIIKIVYLNSKQYRRAWSRKTRLMGEIRSYWKTTKFQFEVSGHKFLAVLKKLMVY